MSVIVMLLYSPVLKPSPISHPNPICADAGELRQKRLAENKQSSKHRVSLFIWVFSYRKPLQ